MPKLLNDEEILRCTEYIADHLVTGNSPINAEGMLRRLSYTARVRGLALKMASDTAGCEHVEKSLCHEEERPDYSVDPDGAIDMCCRCVMRQAEKEIEKGEG